MNDERTPHERGQDDAIRRWLGGAPERASERAVSATIDALRETKQPRRIVLNLSLPMAAAVALLMVVVIGGLALRGTGPLPAGSPSPTPAPSGACSLEQVVGGQHYFVVGRGFAPDRDVVIDIDRANGARLTLSRLQIFSLHTDAQGEFGVELIALSDDVGTGRLSATAGCMASMELIVTPDQVGAACLDPSAPQDLPDTAAYRSAVASDGPLHLWGFDVSSGRFVADSIGDSDGAIVGNDARFMTGQSGTGALFLSGDGTSYVQVPGVELPAEFTIEGWVLLCDDVSNADALVGNGADPPNINFHDVRLRLFVGPSGDDVVIAATVPRIAQWEHWAVTRDVDGVTRVFHNGVLDATGAAWMGVMRIIEIGRGDAGTLRGAIDELAIYDRALTQEELTAHALAQ